MILIITLVKLHRISQAYDFSGKIKLIFCFLFRHVQVAGDTWRDVYPSHRTKSVHRLHRIRLLIQIFHFTPTTGTTHLLSGNILLLEQPLHYQINTLLLEQLLYYQVNILFLEQPLCDRVNILFLEQPLYYQLNILSFLSGKHSISGTSHAI